MGCALGALWGRGALLSALGGTCPGAAVPSPPGTRGKHSLCISVYPARPGGRRLPASMPVTKATPSIAVPTATSLGTLRSGIAEPGARAGGRSGPAVTRGSERSALLSSALLCPPREAVPGLVSVPPAVPTPRRAPCRAWLGWREDGWVTRLPLGDIPCCGVK